MSTHGCALINIMFATPHSAVIECHPPYFFEMSYAQNVMISRVHYILVSFFPSYPANDTRWIKARNAYMDGNFYFIRRQYAYLEVDPPVTNVLYAMQDAIEYLNRWRFIYETNDKWSPLFY